VAVTTVATVGMVRSSVALGESSAAEDAASRSRMTDFTNSALLRFAPSSAGRLIALAVLILIDLNLIAGRLSGSGLAA